MKKILFPLAILIILSGCSDEKLPPVTEKSNITGLASPVRLGHERTQIPFSDFFLEPEMIQKVEIPGLDEDLYFVEGETSDAAAFAEIRYASFSIFAKG